MSTERPKVSVVLIMNERKEVLAVSRKDDHTDFGLPGGKLDPGETFEQAAIRETWEEVGIKIEKLRDVFDHPCREHYAHTFLVEEWSGVAYAVENAVVAWLPISRLIEGSFGDYNRALFQHLGLL